MSDNYVPGTGSLGAKLLILGEAPALQELAVGLPFQGASGKELDRLLKDAEINRAECWITNVCKYYVPPNPPGLKIPFTVRATRAGVDLNEELSNLREEINDIKPNCILALGGTALWALSGKNKISNFRGSILHGMGRKFVATYHPAHLLHQAGGEIKGYWNRFIMVLDFKRAREQSEFPEYILPHRNLKVIQSSYELGEWQNQYRNISRIAVDIEARGSCIPVCVGLSGARHHGITVPLWNREGISQIPDIDLVNCWRILSEILNGKEIIGQNFNYDRDKLKRLGFKIGRLASDLMLKAHAINPELPKRLSFNQSIYTEEPFYKDEGMYEGDIADLLLGCARDACVTKELDEEMEQDLIELEQKDFYENFLMDLPDFYLEIENNGFNVNEEKRKELLRKYIEWDERLRYELFELIGVIVNVNSNSKQIPELLFETLGCPKRDGCGEEELTSLLNLQSFTDPIKRRVVELILEDRRVRRTISHDIMALPDFDGKMKTTCFPCLETGRSSTGQQDPPIRPLIEVTDETGKKKKKALGTPFQTKTKHGDIGPEVRSMYEAGKGCIFVQADSAQAEARVVFLLADDEQALKDIDEHDYHALTASWFFGGSESDYSKKALGYESPIRFAGKTLRHAGHLGAGKRRAATELNTQARKYKIPISITEAIADRALTIFHQKQPNIRQVFHAGVTKALNETRQLIAPVPFGVKSRLGGIRTFYERWGDELFRQAFSYIPQRAVSDNTKAAGIRIKRIFPIAKIILEAHDALLFEVPEANLEEFIPIIQIEMERPIRFDTCSLPRRELIIPCEVEVGYNYQDLKKFKVKELINV